MIGQTEAFMLGVGERLSHEIANVRVLEAVEDANTVPSGGDEIGGAKHTQVSGDGALLGLEQFDQIAHAAFTLGQDQHDAGSGRIGERFESLDHRLEALGVWRAWDGVLFHAGSPLSAFKARDSGLRGRFGQDAHGQQFNRVQEHQNIRAEMDDRRLDGTD